ncbi:MAG: putative Ig domain-containing protein [Dissulfurimicrobium sp.]|uniref:putative Ig domain-containing protein n=1 Tax=Dissulfurimicrobium sp. TaxID=2022436 RepID=UPI004049D064
MPLTINRNSLCKGFTLIEMAIVLVIIGLLIGMGASMMGPLTKRAKLMETRETVKTAYESILGYAAQHKTLPASLAILGVKTSDIYGIPLDYYLWTGTNLCTSAGTYLTVNDSSSGAASTKTNVAFILIARGENRCNQTGTASPFNIYQQGAQVSQIACAAGQDYDDIVMYADIDTVRSKACNTFMITTDSLPTGTEEVTYSSTVLQATDGTLPYTWKITSGALPPGLQIQNLTSGACGTITCSASNPCGCISGTPTQSGSFNFTLTVQDSDTPQRTATKGLAITINPNRPKIVTESIPSGKEGQTYYAIVNVSGGAPPYSWSPPAGTLPSGLTAVCEGTYCKISGIPASGSSGTYTISFTVSDPLYSDTKRFTFAINP